MAPSSAYSNKARAAVDAPPAAAETAIRPPGLPPPASERLWKPHEDDYWRNLRHEWGSTMDVEGSPDGRNDHGSSSSSSSEDENEMDDVDLTTANGTVFRIVLAHGDQRRPECERTGGSVATRTRSLEHHQERAGLPLSTRSINRAPLTDAISLHLPPPAVRKHSKKGGFKANPLNISVTTSTRTYGDFSRMNPPPYTPRPTNAEKSFGRNGNGVAEEEKPAQKRPVAKWLFILGFVFPLFWLFGSFLLFSGLRKLSADSQAESQHSTSSKFDTLSDDTTSDANALSQLIAKEVLWSKRCAWATVLFAVLCFVVLGVLKAVGI